MSTPLRVHIALLAAAIFDLLQQSGSDTWKTLKTLLTYQDQPYQRGIDSELSIILTQVNSNKIWIEGQDFIDRSI